MNQKPASAILVVILAKFESALVARGISPLLFDGRGLEDLSENGEEEEVGGGEACLWRLMLGLSIRGGSNVDGKREDTETCC